MNKEDIERKAEELDTVAREIGQRTKQFLVRETEADARVPEHMGSSVVMAVLIGMLENGLRATANQAEKTGSVNGALATLELIGHVLGPEIERMDALVKANMIKASNDS